MRRGAGTALRYRAAALAAVWLVLSGGLAGAPPPSLHDSLPSLAPRASEIPVAAVVGNALPRQEKQLQSQRVTLQKPERATRHLAASQRPAAPPSRVSLRSPSRDLARRSLPTRRATPRAPDDPSH
jgi:hypothetical protein